MRFQRKSRVGSVIPTASMADISFLLLVFFMVSTVFVRYRGIPVTLPEAEKIEKLEVNDGNSDFNRPNIMNSKRRPSLY